MITLLVFIISLFCFTWQVNADSTIAETPDGETCINELNLNKEELVELIKRYPSPEDNPQFNSFIKCYCKKQGVLNEHDEIDFEQLAVTFFGVWRDLPENAPEEVKEIKRMVMEAIERCAKNNRNLRVSEQLLVKILNYCAASVIMEHAQRFTTDIQ